MKSPTERFWQKVGPADKNGCRLWLASKNRLGYGLFSINHKCVLAHRVAYELIYGVINARLLRHACDNPACCEPSHLVPGTDAENVADCIARGRRHSTAGTKNGRAKLSDEQVREIRFRYAAGDTTIIRLATEFGVGKSQIYNIVSGAQRREWSQYPGEANG